MLAIANRLIFAKIRERLGGRIKVAISGAAPLSADLAEFFEAVGIPLIEGYGLTEGGVAAFNPVDAPRPGSIGKRWRAWSSGRVKKANCWCEARRFRAATITTRQPRPS